MKDFFLEANPNPERIGCPEERTLRALAEDRLPASHPARLHLASCSECFAEFRGFRGEWEQSRKGRRRIIGWALAASLIVASGVGTLGIPALTSWTHSGRPDGLYETCERECRSLQCRNGKGRGRWYQRSEAGVFARCDRAAFGDVASIQRVWALRSACVERQIWK